MPNMEIINHTLTIDGTQINLPRLPVDATVRAWAVPTEYRPDGYFVSVTTPGTPPERPACRPQDAIPLGDLDYPADPDTALAHAKTAKRRTYELATQHFLETLPDGRDRYRPHHTEAFLSAQGEILAIPQEHWTPSMTTLMAKLWSLRDWKMAVTSHWRQQDAALADAENMEALETVRLNLEQFDPTDPGVTLADVLAALGGETG